MDILYIIGKNKSLCDNFELRCSLRSLEKHGKGIDNIYVVGYCPEWLSDSVIKIPFEQPYQQDNITQHEKACNIAASIIFAVDNSNINDDFLVSMDDHIYTKETDFNNYPLMIRNKNGSITLPEHIENETKYDEFLADCKQMLEELNLPIYNFATHRNMYMSRKFIINNKDILIKMINNKKIIEIFCFYGNFYYDENKEYKLVKDVLIHCGAEFYKFGNITNVISLGDFNKHSGLFHLLNLYFNTKSKYELYE